MKYLVNAKVNGNVVAKEIRFDDEMLAKKYIYNLIETYSCEVEEEYLSGNNLDYFCNNHTVFSLKQLQA